MQVFIIRFRIDVFCGHTDIRAARRSYGLEAHLHNRYREDGMVADLAFLKLEIPLPADFPLARLATQEEWEALAEGDIVIALGWGTTLAAATGPDKLRNMVLAVTHRGFFGARVARADRAAENVCVGESGSGLRDETDPALIHGFLSHVTRAADGSICREPGYEATFAGRGWWAGEDRHQITRQLIQGVATLVDPTTPIRTPSAVSVSLPS